ncbi:YaaA family protein, partial [Lacticaseibacillus paracasei]
MKFIIAPAKKMIRAQDDFPVQSQPKFRAQAGELLLLMQQLTFSEAQALWRTSDKLTQTAYNQLQQCDLTRQQSPAIFSYSGIQYQYMAPDLLDDAGLVYIQQHLRILSGLYGILRPFDGVVPYRLEMQNHLRLPHHRN